MAQVKGNCSLTDCPLQRQQAVPRLSDALRGQLAEAYAAQSQSDFRLYRDILQSVEECHSLHFLQMACEKIAKAYRLRDTPSFTEEDLYSHIALSGFIQNFLKAPQIVARYRGYDAKRRHLERYARGLARNIERLAPAVDRERTPANTEYPWVSGRNIYAPVNHHYRLTDELAEPAGRDFLRLIETAIEDFPSITLLG